MEVFTFIPILFPQSDIASSLYTASIIKITYGIDIDDEFVSTAGSALHGFNLAAQPGRYLVELLPIREYCP